MVGSWMQGVAQSWLVLELTNSPFLLGLIGTLQYLPMLLFAVVAGAAADRLPKRRTLVATQTILAAQALVLGLLVGTGGARYWHVGVLAVLWGLVNTLDTPTRQIFIAELVGRDDVLSAISLHMAAFNVARIAGPAVAGVLIARVGLAPAFFLNGLAVLAAVLALLVLRAEGRPAARRRGITMLDDVLAAFRYARETPRILFVLGLLAIVTISVFNFSIYVALLTRDVLGRGPEGFGLLMAALGVGSVTGALALAIGGSREAPLSAIVTAGLLSCGVLLAMGAVRHFWVAAAGLFVLGLTAFVTVVGVNTTLQVTAPDALRGRVVSLYTLVFGGMFPVGAFLAGTVAERWGVSATFYVAGAFGLTAQGALVLWWRLRARSDP